MDQKRFEFASSILLFWVKNSITVDERMLTIKKQNTVFFDLIPLGANKKNIPMGHVSSSDINTKYNFKTIFIGFVVTLLTFWTIIGFFMGIAIMGSGIITTLRVRETSGARKVLRVPFYQKKLALEAADYIQEVLIDVQEQTDVRKASKERDARQAERDREALEAQEKARIASEEQNAALLDALNKKN